MIICWYEKRIYLCNTIVSIRIVDFNLTYPPLNSNHLNPRKKIKEHKLIPKRVIFIVFGYKQLHNPANSFNITSIKIDEVLILCLFLKSDIRITPLNWSFLKVKWLSKEGKLSQIHYYKSFCKQKLLLSNILK